MTPLRQRMIDAMVLRGFSARTQESYTDAIYDMAKHYRRDPAQYSAQEVEAYLLHMINERHLSYSTMNQAACAARFLYEKVLGRERELFPIAMAKVPSKQPELLAREEIARLFANCSHPVHRMLLQTMYASGLRVSEACALQVTDIDSHSDRMCIRVACGKGGHARYTLLGQTLLVNLRIYARTFHPKTWLFCNRTVSGWPLRIDTNSVMMAKDARIRFLLAANDAAAILQSDCFSAWADESAHP